jgi:hypothetical protein
MDDVLPSRWYDSNWNRDYVYLNDVVVRISEGWLWDSLTWNPDLKLYVWNEGGGKMYFMDAQGHYRFWHNGAYIDMILKNK